MLRRLRTLAAVRVTLGLALSAALAMCAVPLLAVHGPESALLLGILLPPMAAFTGARIVQRLRRDAREDGVEVRLSALFEHCLTYAALLFLVPALVLLLDALRVRNCTPFEGLAFMLLGPGFGVVLGSLTGLALGLFIPSHGWAAGLALAAPIATMVWAVLRFYTSPAIFAYGHYFGYFPGTIYDESVSITAPFLWLRVASCAAIAAFVLITSSFVESGSLRFTLRPRSPLLPITGSICAAFVLACEIFAVQLGHESSSERIRAALGGTLRSQRCDVAFPREYAPADRERLAADCDVRVQQAERWLGVTHPEPVHVYLFRSPAEKYALMGAEGTNLAKPWRSEVFISDSGWPNPVLGHEIVHVVARATGAGPLRVGGRLGGFWPDPALIEGVAMAAAWQPAGGLTLHEWSRALLELGHLPELSQLFGAGFLGQQKRLAYVVSGSLLRFVAERWGVRAVRQAYAHGDIAGSVGLTLGQLEIEWHRYLRSQPLRGAALELAKARFRGPSVFSAVCPHALAELRDELRAQLGSGDDAAARATCREILAADDNDVGTRTSLVAALARLGDEAGAARELAWLSDRAPAPFLVAARQALADEAFRRGRIMEAKQIYQALLSEPLDDDQRRGLQVKWLACDSAVPREQQLLFELLIGEPGQRTDGASAVYLTRELRGLRQDGLPAYLEARQLYFVSRFKQAADLFALARRAGLPTQELSIEALRLEAITRFASGQWPEAGRLFEQYGSDGSAARAAEAADWLQRIRLTPMARAEG